MSVSSFINDLILISLKGNNLLKQDIVSRFNQIQKEMELIGYEVNIKAKKGPNGLAESGLGES